jgi:imidazolonepropionase-like amidohydrolase/ABC-type multidrug transport system permease subunit
MRAYLALMRIDLKLALRNRSVIFFNYLFPLIFFFAFAEMMGANRGGGITNIVTMVLTIGILGNGLWGAGMRAVQEREMNILRRFKVTPISPAPILVASMVTGWLIYLPAVALVCWLAHRIYGMPWPERWFSLFCMVTLGVFAFRAIGLILASIVNSTQESTVGIQILYMPMLFLSGATFPTVMLPRWAQISSQFLPATYLVTGFQSVFLRGETLAQNWPAAAALALTMALATFISVQIFRWEKEEKLRPAAKLWVLAVLSPFVVMGFYEAYSNGQKQKSELLWRELMRNDTFLVRGARIFTGSGKVIESGSVLVKNGKIDQVYAGAAPDAGKLKADVVEAAGKTLLPGLIDMHAHLGSPGGTFDSATDYANPNAETRELAAYLYSGVTAVRSVGDMLDKSLESRSRIANGSRLGADLFVCGPMFTAENGHGTEYIQYMPGFLRQHAREQMVRTPKTADEARRQVRELKQAGADCVTAILEAGWPGHPFPRLDTGLLKAIGEEARAQKMPLAVHTGNARDVEDALDAGAASIEHGSFSDEIPDALFARMVKEGVAYDPTLSVINALTQPVSGELQLLTRSLVLQIAPKNLIESTKRAVAKNAAGRQIPAARYEQAKQNLLRAYRVGVRLIAGSDAGNMLVIHGPTGQEELLLWTQAGIPAAVGLQAVTYNAARTLGADSRFGLIEAGREANLLLVDGDPLADISVTERISLVVFRGERVRRNALLDQK